MRILIFTSMFPPEIGGVENVTINLAQQFKGKGHNVKVLTSLKLKPSLAAVKGFKKIFSFFKIMESDSKYSDFSVKRVHMSLPRSLMGFLSFPYRLFWSVLLIRLEIFKFKPNVVNFHFPDDSLYYFYFTMLGCKTRYVVNIHGNELHMFSKNRIYKFVLTKVFKGSREIIVNSHFMKETLLSIYPTISDSKINIVNNGLNLGKFSNLEDKTVQYKKNSYYLYVGRLDNKKGIDILIKVFNKIGKKLKRKLIIVGGSSIGTSSHGAKSLEEYKKMADADLIIFEGWVEPALVPYYFKNAYFSVFPSRHEPFGLVGIESMASGTPIIASSGGFEEVLSDTKAGIAFKPESEDELEKILLKVDKNPEIRSLLAKRSQPGAAKYDWSKISVKYLEIFDKARK